MLAALIRVVDMQHIFNSNQIADLPTTVQTWIDTLDAVFRDTAVQTAQLESYIRASNAALPGICAANQGSFLNLSLLEIMYRSSRVSLSAVGVGIRYRINDLLR